MKTNNKRLRVTYFFAVTLALVASAVYLHTSQTIGRLHQDLMYDDIKYVNDAVSRLTTGYEGGFLDFLSTFAVTPPHSPFSTLLACGALFVGGYHDSAVYVANSIILVATSIFLVCLFKHARTGTIVWIVTTFLCSPFAYRTIHDFKPDIVLGFTTAMMAYFFALGLFHNRRHFKLAGTLFGCCLLIKPTFFAHTFALAICLVALHQTLNYKQALHIPSCIAIPRRLESIRFMLIGVFLALPYFALNAKHTFGYFWTFTHGTKASVWSFPAETPLFVIAEAYLFGNRFIANSGLAGAHGIIMSLCIIAGLSLTIYRRNIKSLFIVLTLLYTALISFLIIVIGRHNNGFFMATFYSLLFFAGFFSFSYVSRNVRRKNNNRVLLVVAWAALLIAIYANRSLVHWQLSAEASAPNSWNSKIVAAVVDDISRQGFAPSEEITLFVSMAGPVNEETIKWTATKHGANIHPLTQRIFLSDARDNFINAAKETHYILVPNQINSEYYRWLPSEKLQIPFLNFLRNNPQFRQVQFFSKDDHYYLFANLDVLSPNIEIK